MSTAAPTSLDLQYPTGRFKRAPLLSPEEREPAIQTLAGLPAQMANAITGLSDAQLDTPYRPGGWTVRQLVHHVADSHMNAYARVRHALTADWPTIFAYDQSAWAELPDARQLPASVSVQMLDSIHQRLVTMLRGIADADWTARGYVHPETGRQMLADVLPLYAWHSRHHLAHIVNARARHGW